MNNSTSLSETDSFVEFNAGEDVESKKEFSIPDVPFSAQLLELIGRGNGQVAKTETDDKSSAEDAPGTQSTSPAMSASSTDPTNPNELTNPEFMTLLKSPAMRSSRFETHTVFDSAFAVDEDFVEDEDLVRCPYTNRSWSNVIMIKGSGSRSGEGRNGSGTGESGNKDRVGADNHSNHTNGKNNSQSKKSRRNSKNSEKSNRGSDGENSTQVTDPRVPTPPLPATFSMNSTNVNGGVTTLVGKKLLIPSSLTKHLSTMLLSEHPPLQLNGNGKPNGNGKTNTNATGKNGNSSDTSSGNNNGNVGNGKSNGKDSNATNGKNSGNNGNTKNGKGGKGNGTPVNGSGRKSQTTKWPKPANFNPAPIVAASNGDTADPSSYSAGSDNPYAPSASSESYESAALALSPSLTTEIDSAMLKFLTRKVNWIDREEYHLVSWYTDLGWEMNYEYDKNNPQPYSIMPPWMLSMRDHMMDCVFGEGKWRKKEGERRRKRRKGDRSASTKVGTADETADKGHEEHEEFPAGEEEEEVYSDDNSDSDSSDEYLIPPPNSCNWNLYKNGNANIGAHADDEILFDGLNREIKIIGQSFGEEREFQYVARKKLEASERIEGERLQDYSADIRVVCEEGEGNWTGLGGGNGNSSGSANGGNSAASDTSGKSTPSSRVPPPPPPPFAISNVRPVMAPPPAKTTSRKNSKQESLKQESKNPSPQGQTNNSKQGQANNNKQDQPSNNKQGQANTNGTKKQAYATPPPSKSPTNNPNLHTNGLISPDLANKVFTPTGWRVTNTPGQAKRKILKSIIAPKLGKLDLMVNVDKIPDSK